MMMVMRHNMIDRTRHLAMRMPFIEELLPRRIQMVVMRRRTHRPMASSRFVGIALPCLLRGPVGRAVGYSPILTVFSRSLTVLGAAAAAHPHGTFMPRTTGSSGTAVATATRGASVSGSRAQHVNELRP
jgi:hypothetical protein